MNPRKHLPTLTMIVLVGWPGLIVADPVRADLVITSLGRTFKPNPALLKAGEGIYDKGGSQNRWTDYSATRPES
jgi:hypothetical protein